MKQIPSISAVVAAAALAAAAVLIFSTLSPILSPWRAPGCEQRAMLAQAPSPDGAWVAAIYNNICSDGAFVTTIDDTVEITRPDEPSSPVPSTGVVFGMDDRPYDTKKPLAVTWLDRRSLEVTIPNDAWAGKQELAYADVTITYKYVPDDPVERACLKQWRSLPTQDQVRRSQSATENIRAFLSKCEAESRPR